MDYYQVLGIKRGSDPTTVRKAFRQLSRDNHPDRFDEKDRESAEKKYQQIVIAFNTLKDPRQRQAYDKLLSRGGGSVGPSRSTESPADQARKYFQNGMTRMQAGQHEQAAECFKRAVHFQQDAEFFYHKGLAEAQVAKLRRDALKSFERAIELKPKTAKYYVQMIKVLHGFGLTARSKVYLEKAMQLFQGDDALAQLAQEIDPKKSFWGGLFKS